MSLDQIYKFFANNIGITKAICTGVVVLFIANRYYLKSNNTNPSSKTRQSKPRDFPIRIQKILIYPIKSCKAVEITSTEFDKYGLNYDRNWMLIQNGRFMTQRNTPTMSLLIPRISEDGKYLIISKPNSTEELKVSINTDTSTPTLKAVVWKDTVNVLDCGDEASKFLSEFLNKENVRLVQVPKGDGYCRKIDDEHLQNLDGGAEKNQQYQVNLSDASPIMVLSQSSIDALNQKIREERNKRGEEQKPDLTWERFRPNVLVIGTDPFEEDHWKSFRIGGLLFDTIDHTSRCKLTTVEPSTGVLDPYHDEEPLRTMRTFRTIDSTSPLFGVFAIHNGEGPINVGDIVDVLDDSFKSKNHQTPIYSNNSNPTTPQ